MEKARTKIPAVPIGLAPQLFSFLQHMRSHLNAISATSAPPSPASNLTVTPSSLGNIIHFTAGDNATNHVLLISTTPTWDPSRSGNSVIDLGHSNEFYHHVGQSGVKRYYSIVARRNGASATPTAPASGATLAYNVAAATPPFVPPGKLATSLITGKPTIIHTGRGQLIDP